MVLQILPKGCETLLKISEDKFVSTDLSEKKSQSAYLSAGAILKNIL
jgi:hypothetical protein